MDPGRGVGSEVVRIVVSDVSIAPFLVSSSMSALSRLEGQTRACDAFAASLVDMLAIIPGLSVSLGVVYGIVEEVRSCVLVGRIKLSPKHDFT